MYENETYEEILNRILARMPETMDIRESSFLYNASAPIAAELTSMYIALDNILNITFFDTADREGKLQRCKERGVDITQFDATFSVCIMETSPTTVEIDRGTIFSYNNVNFVVTEKIDDGEYKVRCNTAGTSGNVTGEVTPVNYIEGLESAEITSIYQWGEDEASESQIDNVFYASLDSQAFGGNRADYLQKTKSIAGVGGVKVYSGSEWQGGGTVKLVLTTSSYTKPSSSFINNIQTIIDPTQNSGEGYGLAPIGHTVTVVGVDETTINVSMNVTLQDGYTWKDVSDYVNNTIDTYLQSLNEGWDDVTQIIVRVSQLEARILDVTGIIDISNTKINGASTNLSVDKDSIVVRGSVDVTT